jgi:hypothetical protein
VTLGTHSIYTSQPVRLCRQAREAASLQVEQETFSFPVETVPRKQRRINRMMEGVDLTKIYREHFCKCHNVPPVQQ